jgi:PKD repeat protein
MKRFFLLLLAIFFVAEGVGATAVTTMYYLGNTSVWVCPANWTTVNVMMTAGGNGGVRVAAPGMNGTGGFYSPIHYYSGVTVVPGSSYTIVVGDGGNTTGVDPASYNGWGASTSAFGFTVGPNTTGTNTFTTVPGASDGRNGYGSLVSGGSTGNGVGGTGNGAGGAGVQMSFPSGLGAPGMVWISNGSFIDTNVPMPAFSAVETTITPGSSATFTDESIVTNTTGLTYNWSFGDGTYSTTIGSLSHIYTYQGTYTVSLTITAGGNTATSTKVDYINVVVGAQQVQYTTPHDVKINVRSLTSGPVSGVHVTCTFVETSGPWSWITKWIGGLTGSGETSVQNTTLSGTTDSNGAIDFLLVSAVQYNITAYLPGVIDQTLFIYPTDNDYTFWSSGAINGSAIFENSCNQEVIQAAAHGTENPTETIGNISVSYFDPMNSTIGVRIFINQSHVYGNFTNETSLANTTVMGIQNFTRYFEVSSPADQSYLVHLYSNTTGCGNVTRDYGVTFPPPPVSLGIPIPLLVYAGMIIMVFISLGFTTGYVGQTLAAMTVWGWAAFLMRWWNDLAPAEYVVGALIFMTLMTVLYNMAIRSKKVVWS